MTISGPSSDRGAESEHPLVGREAQLGRPPVGCDAQSERPPVGRYTQPERPPEGREQPLMSWWSLSAGSAKSPKATPSFSVPPPLHTLPSLSTHHMLPPPPFSLPFLTPSPHMRLSFLHEHSGAHVLLSLTPPHR